jgi:hypothetical protein
MSSACTRICQIAGQHANNYELLRQHLLEGARCPDAWFALARLLKDPARRLECLRLAAQLAPDDLDIQIGYLEQLTALNPQDRDSDGRLRQLRATRALEGYRAPVLRWYDQPRTVGQILKEQGAVGDLDLQRALEAQKKKRLQGLAIPLGTILVETHCITPDALAHALSVQEQEREACGHTPVRLGEQLVRQGTIQVHDLELALLEQIRLHQQGEHLSLGKILLRQGKITMEILQQALDHQWEYAMSSYI